MVEIGQSRPYGIWIDFLLLLIFMSNVYELWNPTGKINKSLENGSLTDPLIISM